MAWHAVKSVQRQPARAWQETSPERKVENERYRAKVCANERKFKGRETKKKDRGRGLVWLVCGDLQRANAVSLPSGSLASV